MSNRDETNITRPRVLKAFALATANYYAAEKAFRNEPTEEALRAFFVANERFAFLRGQLFRGVQVGDAIAGSEQEAADVA